MPLHGHLPVRLTVGIEDRLRADCRREKEQLRTVQDERTRGLRKPLIPADADADCRIACFPCQEAGVSGREIEFLLIVMVIRNMRFAVDTEQRAVGINDRFGIKQTAVVPLIKADRQHDRKLLCERHAAPDCRILLGFLRKCVIFIAALLTEILPLEELRQQDNLCAFCGSAADEPLCGLQAFCRIGAALHLHGSDCNMSAHCESLLSA